MAIYEAGGETGWSHCLAEKLTVFAENEGDKKNIGVVSAGVAAGILSSGC